jgi:hypothetical protein
MIIKNEYIKIKSDKEITLHNYIYDKYLELVAKAQYDKSVMDFSMIMCYLKFDVPFDDVLNKTPSDFDMSFAFSNRNITYAENSIEANYTYTPLENRTYKPSTSEIITDFSEYIGKKITAIGFSTNINYQPQIVACVDTSNYSTYFQENISFQRKDIFSSDTTVKDGYPINLTPFSEKTIIERTGHGDIMQTCYPVLYSIGLGTRSGEMQEEYIIGEDVDVIVESDTSFGFNLRRGLESNKYPAQRLYAGNGLYPLPLKVNKELHPHKKLYTGSGIVPLLSDYKYIMYKYRYYYFDDFAYDYIYINEFFTTNLPNDTKGLFEIVTKIERSDV